MMNNISAYNNGGYGISALAGNKYYGTTTYFGNGYTNINGANTGNQTDTQNTL
jgi:hypothetical protein